MPKTEVRQYRDDRGDAPFQEWLAKLKISEPKAYAKCLAFIAELASIGHEMRRPHAAPLRDKIYELRPSIQGIHYRILYFYYGKNFAVLSHGITKEDVVPAVEIDRAVYRRKQVESNPEKYLMGFPKPQ